MKGWSKLGSLLDKKDQMPQGQPAGSLMDRLASMVSKLERRIRDAFNNGHAARRFNGADVVVLPVGHFEEVREVQAPKDTMSMGRFGHVTQMRLPELEEVFEN
jgi:hypothetical protein